MLCTYSGFIVMHLGNIILQHTYCLLSKYNECILTKENKLIFNVKKQIYIIWSLYQFTCVKFSAVVIC